ncbi:RluA family pseudouridine synthase [Cohnella nanjingensis]|uniref:Pseudouridine synthase n=1 Tax=Cohnella nanjingensis TaxID=1387779 RepID=A0A7X0RTE8_9BACL|nr:RluA family pseudouridine synthase [Cohnella nanjingensis]MBB6673198.1 RluA family pseudouridine synthase [Cohnella nanjingensis]
MTKNKIVKENSLPDSLDRTEAEALEAEDSAEEELLEWTVSEAQAGQRIDKFVTEQALDAASSRSQIQEWIRDGHVTVGGQSVKPNAKLQAGMTVEVRVPEPEPVEALPEDIPLDVIYEDGDVIVINKPRGLVVHPAAGHARGTVVNALLYHCRDLSGINGMLRPGIVHRIDKDTTGLLMAAKNDLAHASLAEQLKAHTVTRRYLALVYGNVPHDRGTIDAPIGRDSNDRKLFTVTDKGSKRAVTHFAVVERFGDYTLVELKLETGRTHQIRVHMKYIGHTLVGDPFYGGRSGRTLGMTGQALHAGVLGFDHPRTGEKLEFSVPLPEDMEHALHMLRTR